jgi:DNA polymerase-3 subunit epsilon
MEDVETQLACDIVQLPSSQQAQREKMETSTLLKRKALQLSEHDRQLHQSMMQRIHKESGGKALWV